MEHVSCAPCGAIGYGSALSFFLVNLPGLPVARLLPYEIVEPFVYRTLREVVLVLTTSALLFAVIAVPSLAWRHRWS
jgi:hypothetical protein